MNRRTVMLLLLLLPTLAATGWIGVLLWRQATAPEIRVAIRGFDPRDLLRGHYLEFQLDLSDDVSGLPCACLTPSPADPLRPTARTCAIERSCPLRLDEPDRVFRYYLPREEALAWQQRLQEGPGGASVLMRLPGGAAPSFSGLRQEPAAAPPLEGR